MARGPERRGARRREVIGAAAALLIPRRGAGDPAPNADPAFDVRQNAQRLVEQGDSEGVLRLLEDWLRRNRRVPPPSVASVRLEAAWLAATTGLPDRARLHLAALQSLLSAFRQAPAKSGRLQREMARVAERIGEPAMAERLLVGAEKGLGGDPAASAEAANALGTTRLALLRPREAAADFERSRAVLSRAGIVQGEPVVAALVNLANAQLELGAPDRAGDCVTRARAAAGTDETLLRAASYAEAQVKLKQPDLVGAERILEQLAAAPEDDPVRGHALLMLATVRFNRGLLPEADRAGVAAADAYRVAFGETSPDFAQALHLLGTTHERLRDLAGAASFFERASDIRRHSFGETSLQFNATEIERAWLDVQTGQLTEAERRSRTALDAFRRASPPQRRYEGLAHILLGLIAEARDKPAEATTEFRAGQDLIAAADGQYSPDLGFSFVRLGRLLSRGGRYKEAEVPLDRAKALFQRLRSDGTVRLADALAARAELREHQGDRDGALDDSRHSYNVLRARWTLDADGAGAAGTFERNSARTLFSTHARLVLRLDPTDSGREEAFAATQDALNSRVGDVLRRAAIRAATVDGPLGRLLHSREEAADALRQAEVLQLDALSRGPVALAEAARLDGIRTQWATRLTGIDSALAASFPGFAAFAWPKPVSIEQVQAVLDPNEALVLSSGEPERMLLWAVTRNGTDAVTVAAGEQELADLVQRLRAGVDLDLIPAGGTLPPFDFKAAQLLYSYVIEPLSTRLDPQQSLVFALDGVLQTFPPYLMTRGEPEDWLIRRFAAAITPSPAAFVAGRGMYTASRAVNAFLGVGDPRLTLFGRPVQATLRGPSPELRQSLARLNALPETADELRLMAGMFQGQHTELIDRAASKSGVFSAVPETFRIIAFATHAIMPGQPPGLTEPAIILTPDGFSDWDGLLMASDVANMQLDADLVILSACNTAAPEQGPLADNFSGLVRAFLHAGARAILVTHWAVSSVPTVKLTTAFVRELQADKRLRKGEALRRSMLRMLGSGDSQLTHPCYWAPFIVVGD